MYQTIQQLEDMKFSDDFDDQMSLLKLKYTGEIDMKKTSNQIMVDKYYEAFNFYFSKPTNEMIVNIEIPHVILFKDYLYYDDINEFLKRPYKTKESKLKIPQLIEFYQQYETFQVPIMCTVNQGKIMNKRAMKLQFCSDKNKQGDDQSCQDKKQVQEELSISNRVLTSHFQDQLNDELPMQYNDQMNFDNQYQMESFETNSFDIYNPNFSGYSSFGDHIEQYANRFETNSYFSSKLDLTQGGLANVSIQSSDKSELLMFQEFITKTNENLPDSPNKKIVSQENKNFKKHKKSPKKKKIQPQFLEEQKLSQIKAQINTKRQKSQKRKRNKAPKSAVIQMKQKLANFKKSKQKQKILKRASSKNAKNAKENSKKTNLVFDQEIQFIAQKLKEVSRSNNKKKQSDGFIYKLLRKEQDRHHTQGTVQKVKKVQTKKKENQRYNPTPIPQSARSKKMKAIQKNKKKIIKKQRNSSTNKKKTLRFNKQKQQTRQGGQMSMTNRKIQTPKDSHCKQPHGRQIKFNNFLQKKMQKQKNKPKKQANVDFKLNLNNLRMKIQDSKNSINYQELIKKAGFWSSRSKNNYQYSKKKKGHSKNKIKQNVQQKYLKKKNNESKKHIKSSRVRKNKSKSKKRLSKNNILTQSQPSLISLKNKRKLKRKSHGEIKQSNKIPKPQKRSSLQFSKGANESSSLTGIQHYNSSRIRTSEENIQKTRQLIANFKEKVKQKEIKDVYYFYQQ